MDIQQLINSGIIEKYVLGLASQEEMDHVEQMAKEYPEVDKHICKMQNCMEEYADLNCSNTPKHIKAKMFSQKGGIGASLSSGQDTVQHLPQSWKWGAGIAAMMIVTLGGLSWVFYNNQKDALNKIAILSTQLKHLQSDQNVLLAKNEQVVEGNVVLKDMNTQKIHLKSSGSETETHAVLFFNPKHGKCLLNVIGLPKCPFGNEYQMWAKTNNKYIDLGMLKMDDEKSELYNIPFIKDCESFVITLEKPGGSPLPTVENMYAYAEM